MSILEAMAHRLPVIASNVGAIATQVLDDETGLLVPPGDAAALADALERLCRDPELRRKMGDAGFTRWRDRYSIATVTKQVVRSEEHTSELQSLMRISYAVFCLKKKK